MKSCTNELRYEIRVMIDALNLHNVTGKLHTPVQTQISSYIFTPEIRIGGIELISVEIVNGMLGLSNK